MTQKQQTRQMDKQEEAHRWEKLAILETDVSGIKRDIAGLDGRIADLGNKFDASLSRLFDKVENGTKRVTPWGLIFSFSGVAGMFVLALASWANAYFGQAIGAAQREATQSMAAHGALQTQINTNREEAAAAAIQAARLDERQKFIIQELDRLRQVSHPRGNENRLD